MGVLRFNTQCINCILKKFLGNVPPEVDEPTRLRFARGLMKIMAEADDSVSAPEIVAEATALKNKMFGDADDFAEVKSHFNALMLSYEPKAKEKLCSANDPLLAAAKLALMGNYIDFGAMDSVDEGRLDGLLNDVDTLELNKTEYQNLTDDLGSAKSLVYLTDNCGEVVLDKLFIGELKNRYPKLKITVLVRGEAVLNDATMQDAKEIGLTEVVEVLSNGTNIAGTCCDKLSPEAKAALLSADVIISKGQGNFETMHHCGLNVYYLFLCKCKLFSDQFKVPPFTGMLLNDRRMNDKML